MRKFMAIWFISFLLVAILGCEAYDNATGYTPAKPAVTNPDGSVTPAQPAKSDVANSPVGKVVNTVDAATSVTPIGPVVHLAGTGLLALLSIIGFARGAQWKNAALATGQGIQNVVSALDAAHVQSAPQAASAVADLIKKAIDAAHDDHGVSQGLQNTLTPTT